MNKSLIIGIVAVVAVVGGGIFFLSQKDTDNTSTTTNGSVTAPTTVATYNGMVVKVEGNEITLNNIVQSLTEAEQAARKAERQSMSQEERQALRQQELTEQETTPVTFQIPVGTAVYKSSGTGNQAAALVQSSLADITIGVNISVWKSGESIDFVKIKGTQSE